MSEPPRSNGSGRRTDPHALRTAILGVLAGGGLLLTIMLLAAGLAVAFGLISHDAAGRLNLLPWLVLEIVVGAVASFLAGTVSRRIARRYVGPAVLAAAVFTVGLLEATEILRHAASSGVTAPKWLVLLAPIVAAAGVLLGGWRPRTRSDRIPQKRRTTHVTEAIRYSSPVFVLAAAAALALFVLPGLSAASEPGIVASALAVDFTVVVPGIVYLLFVRAKRAPWVILIPTFVVGYAMASATIPNQHHGVLETIRLLVIPAEFAVVVYLVVLARKALTRVPNGDGDFATRFRSAARAVLASRIPADILTTEISILYYAFRWRRSAPQIPGSYTVHRDVGYLPVVIGLIMVLLVESVAVHLMVSQWSSTAAWTLTGLSAYACIWLVGDYRAMSARPNRITRTHLLLRMGVRWEADIPISGITHAAPLASHKESTKRDTLVAVLLGQPNLRLKLKVRTEVIGMYGIRRSVQEIWLTVDESAKLCAELQGSGRELDSPSQPARIP